MKKVLMILFLLVVSMLFFGCTNGPDANTLPVTFHFKDADTGTTIPNVTVTLYNLDLELVTMDSNSTGGIRFLAPPGDNYYIIATKSGYLNARSINFNLSETTPPNQRIEMIADTNSPDTNTSSISFTTTDANTGDPISNPTVKLYRNSTLFDTIDSNTGTFTNLPSDRYTLNATALGYHEKSTAGFELGINEHINKTIEMIQTSDINGSDVNTARLTFHVEDANFGTVIPNATVTLRQGGNNFEYGTMDSNSNGEGTFLTPPGNNYYLMASKTGYQNATSTTFNLATGYNPTITIKMIATDVNAPDTNSSSISFITTDVNAQGPIENASVDLYWNYSYFQTIDSNAGTFTDLPIGNYYFQASAPGYETKNTTSFPLGVNEHVNKTIEMMQTSDTNVSGGKIELTISHEEEGPITGVAVTLQHWTGNENIYLDSTTNQNGLAIFSGITDTGAYDFYEVPGYTLVPGQSTRVAYFNQSEINSNTIKYSSKFLEHTGNVSFSVKDAVTNQPISDVNSTLLWYTGDYFMGKNGILSDSQGFGAFGLEIFGLLRINATKPNYSDFTVDFNHPTGINGTSDINFFMVPTDFNTSDENGVKVYLVGINDTTGELLDNIHVQLGYSSYVQTQLTVNGVATFHGITQPGTYGFWPWNENGYERIYTDNSLEITQQDIDNERIITKQFYMTPS